MTSEAYTYEGKVQNSILNYLREDLPRFCLMFSWRVVKNIYHEPFEVS